MFGLSFAIRKYRPPRSDGLSNYPNYRGGFIVGNRWTGPEDTMSRFWRNVHKNGPIPPHYPELGPCWLWTGTISSTGYGNFGIKEEGIWKRVNVHRFSYQTFVGLVPIGFELDHLCRVRACVNTNHLEPVTHRENAIRGCHENIRYHNLGICKRGHEQTVDNKRKGNRGCRECSRITVLAWHITHRRTKMPIIVVGNAKGNTYLCQDCGIELRLYSTFAETAAVHNCPKYILSHVDPEPAPGAFNKLRERGPSATTAERRNAKPEPHQQRILRTGKAHKSVRHYRGDDA